MSRLFDLIDAYRAEQGGMAEAAFARKAGMSKNGLNNWRNRGMKRMPPEPTLRAIAEAMSKDYETVVLAAVLLDLGWVDPPAPSGDPASRERTA